MAEISACRLALLSYLLPEHSFVQVLVHCMCVLFACSALCFLSLQWSLTGPLEVEFCMQRALCYLLLCAHFDASSTIQAVSHNWYIVLNSVL